jgi:CRISPR-associated Cas5-like protein
MVFARTFFVFFKNPPETFVFYASVGIIPPTMIKLWTPTAENITILG